MIFILFFKMLLKLLMTNFLFIFLNILDGSFLKYIKFLILFFFLISNTLRKNTYYYSIIIKLQNPSNKLIIKWGIYYNFKCYIFSKKINLNDYWLGLIQQLLLLFKIILDYIWFPILSCNVKWSFFIYNSLLDSDC